MSLASLPLGVMGANQAFAGDFDLPFPESCADCAELEQFYWDNCVDVAPGSSSGIFTCDDIAHTLETCRPNFCLAVGGDMIQMETTSILVSGAQHTAAWMIPAIIAAAGIGIVLARKF